MKVKKIYGHTNYFDPFVGIITKYFRARSARRAISPDDFGSNVRDIRVVPEHSYINMVYGQLKGEIEFKQPENLGRAYKDIRRLFGQIGYEVRTAHAFLDMNIFKDDWLILGNYDESNESKVEVEIEWSGILDSGLHRDLVYLSNRISQRSYHYSDIPRITIFQTFDDFDEEEIREYYRMIKELSYGTHVTRYKPEMIMDITINNADAVDNQKLSLSYVYLEDY